MKNQSAVIIGGGVGGLFTGAFLAKNGVKVTVLEKNPVYGGGLQCFSRRGKIFETGMHVMGGFGKDGVLTKICRYLGIYDDLNIRHIPTECMDEIYYAHNGERFSIGSGKERYIESIASCFPDERENLIRYVDNMFELTTELPLFYLKENVGRQPDHSDMFTWPADRFIAHFIKDEKLQELLAYLNPLYAGVKGHTPVYIHALINTLFINGPSRFEGGSQQLADALKKIIEQNEGLVLCNKEVTGIYTEDRLIAGITTSDESVYTGDWYVSAIHPTVLTRLLPPGAFRRSFIRRLEEIPNSCSAFSLYIDLKPDMFPYIDHTCYFIEDHGLMWNQDKVNSNGNPRAFMYMTPPDVEQGEYASRLLVHCVMSFDEVRRWEESRLNARDNDYKLWKKQIEEKIISKLETLYPNLRDMIEAIYSSSPLTIRDFFNTKEGSMFGYSKDTDCMLLSHLPVHTTVKNLLLTGQNVNLHGICGVPLTAIHTSEAILGNNKLVNAINKANESE